MHRPTGNVFNGPLPNTNPDQSSPGGRTHGTRRYGKRVGFVVLDCEIALSVSCCLRQPRIAFEATHSFSKISRTALAAVFCELGINEANLG